jgi:hypothetical protein
MCKWSPYHLISDPGLNNNTQLSDTTPSHIPPHMHAAAPFVAASAPAGASVGTGALGFTNSALLDAYTVSCEGSVRFAATQILRPSRLSTCAVHSTVDSAGSGCSSSRKASQGQNSRVITQSCRLTTGPQKVNRAYIQADEECGQTNLLLIQTWQNEQTAAAVSRLLAITELESGSAPAAGSCQQAAG